MKGKRFVALLAGTALSASLFAGCGAKGSEKGVLTIRYFEGGYGREWIESAAEEFKAYKKEKDGVEIGLSLTADASITANALTTLKSNNNVPDLMLTQGGSWTEWVSRGYLEPLTSVFDTQVQTSAGMRTVRDFLKDENADRLLLQRLYGQGDWQEWVMPWASLECALAYNEGYLRTVNASVNYEGLTANGKWTAFPKTVEQLQTYFADVNAMDDDVVPIIWGGSDGSNWFNYPLQVYWAQQQGYTKTNENAGIAVSEGTYKDFFNYSSADVWKQTGIQNSIDIVRSLFVDTENKTWKNTTSRVKELTIQDAEAEFVKGNAAVMLAGSFLENEMKEFTPEGMTIKMATFPLSENCETDESGNPIKYHFLSEGDIMFVPAKAVNKDLAKEFLAFISSEEQVMKFTKYTGCMRPFEYNPLDLAPDYGWTSYQRSSFEIITTCTALSQTPSLAKQDRPAYLIYGGLSWNASVNFDTLTARMLRMTGSEIMLKGDAGMRSVYELGKECYKDAKDTYGE